MAGKRGRTPGFVMPEAHRLKIKNSNILKVLIDAAEGIRDISSTQANIGIALLRKVLPDLSATTLSGDAENPLQVKTIERIIVHPTNKDGGGI